MKFQVMVDSQDGSHRVIEVESKYDAVAIVADETRRRGLLRAGESIATRQDGPRGPRYLDIRRIA